jgi:serine/threonine protein phosphatase PrpC
MSNTLQVSIGFKSTAGVKPENQDSVNYAIPTGKQLELKGISAVIADGVSSSEAAKQASSTAVKSFLQDFYSTPDTWSTKQACQQVVSSINSWLYQQGTSEANELRGWVTTFDSIIFKSTSVFIVHVGDARIYRYRQGTLTQLTKDHQTWLSKDQSYLSRALGIDSVLQIDFKVESVEEDDLYLMTTDGVHEFLTEEEIINGLLLQADEEQIAQSLVDTALKNGSDDNLTAQVIRVKQLPSASKEEVYQKLSELPFPPELEPGMKLDGYEILQVINLSSRSQIYLAKDMETGHEVALKTPSANYSDDPWYLDGFVREEWIGQSLKHPGLMKTFQSNRTKQFLYFTTEYIKGQSLKQWIHEHRHPPLQDVRDIINQIACALRALHRLGIIHQDLKPDNIMIDDNNRIKIIDFGAVHVASLAETASVIERHHPEGTLHYTAPEYLLGEKGSNRSDIFSLGVIAYEMLTGALPYKEKQINPFNLKSYHHMQYIPAKHARKDIPDWLDMSLKTACEPNPEKRYPLLSEFTVDFTKPKPDMINKNRHQPLLERNPTAFWKGLSALLFLIVLIQWWWLTN